jgi:hypothetical protein
MASVVAICNAGMRKVGASTITSLNQGTKNANFCNDRYAELRDALLEMHTWNFAAKRVKLARTTTVPAIKFDYTYALPADFNRVVSVYDSDDGFGIVDHKVENNTIVCSAEEVWLLYVALITDPNKMSPLFREALAALMAIEAATAIVDSRTLREDMVVEFNAALRRARSADAMGDLPDRMPVGSWVTTRSGRMDHRRWSW